MYSSRRRPRTWLISAKVLIVLVAIPIVFISTLDGVNYREIAGLLVVLAVGLVIAHRADRLHSHIDDLEKRLTDLKTPV